ncbi:MAG: ABC transporter substrate-binding protein [Rhodococcus sp.]|nr:ABC transporter substrate-binding protein [Rhodococcus sp. (in: high G+C Gram-positive bacteria)]
MKLQWTRKGRIRLGAALAAAALVVGVSACSSNDDADNTSAPVSANADAFPVTLTGKFGEATVEAPPVRALPLSPQDADILLSLGVTPIALPVDRQNLAATNNTGVWPWEEQALKDLGSATPELLQLDAGLGSVTENIVALEPDIIVSTGFWGLDQTSFDQLNPQIPVVHFDTQANGEPWQDSTRKVAEALGIPEKAEEVIAQADASLQEAKQAHPEFEGKTYNAIIGDMGGGQLAVLASDERGIGQFLSSLGLTLSPYATTLPVDPDGRGLLSYENIGDLDADVLVVVSPTGDLEYLTKFEAWNQLPAVQAGAVVSLARNTGRPNAVGFPSALSLDWATDQVAPEIAEAIEKGSAR